MPVEVRKSDDGVSVYLTDELGAFESIGDFRSQIGGAQKVEIFVDSLGGCSSAAFEIYDALRPINAIAYIHSRCFSAAAIATMACRKVLIERGAGMMLHQVTGAYFGNRDGFLQKAEQLLDVNERMVRAICHRTGVSHEIARRWLSCDTFFSAESAVRAGLADEIFDMPHRIIRGSGASVSPALPSEPTCDESKAQLLRACLESIGPITTANREALINEIRAWTLMNIQQFAAPCDPASFAEVACPSLAA